MKSLNHPNIVNLLDVYHIDNMIYIIQEYCNQGTLECINTLN
jgi:serine/threonine protein kinase